MAANPNTLSYQQVWDAEYQITHYKQAVFPAIADERLIAKLRRGTIVNRTYSSNLVANDMGADGAYSTQGVTDTDEALTVNKAKEASFYLKSLDEIQSQLDVKRKYARKAMNALWLQIDGDVLGAAYQGANSAIDDGTLGGTKGNGISLSSANIPNLFSTAQMLLKKQNVIYNTNKKFTGKVALDKLESYPVAIVSPDVTNQLNQYLGSKNSKLGDDVNIRGYQGMFMGFNIFESNNTGWSAVLAFATIATANDTVTINGVVFTFVATPTAAGDVVVADTAAHQCTNFANALNALGTDITNSSSAGYKAISAANQNLLKNLTASNPTTTSVKIIMTGYGTVVVSQSMTASANVWTSTSQLQHCVFGVSQSISLVIQKSPSLFINPVSGKVGRDFATWAAYGWKVFKDQTFMLLDAQINSSTFTAPANSTN